MKDKAMAFEDIPRILTQILFELKRINNGQGIDAPPFELEPPKVQETKEPETAPVSSVSHDELKKFCVELNRTRPGVKPQIRKVLSSLGVKKVDELPAEKLDEAFQAVKDLGNAA